MKNKLYHGTKTKFNFICSIIFDVIMITVAVVILSIFINTFKGLSIEGLFIACSLPIFFMGYFGIYPLYLHCIYYKYDRNVSISINYETREMKYMLNNKLIQTVYFDDIIKIKVYDRMGMLNEYYRIIIRNAPTILVTCVISLNFCRAFPRIYIERIPNTNLLLPKKEIKNNR